MKWAEDKRSDAAAIESRRPRAIPLSLAALAAAVVGVVVGVAVWMLKPAPSATTPAVVRLAVTLHAGEQVPAGYPMALSSDGRQLAYIASNRMYLRSMNSLASKALAGTEGAQAPFFSPDGQWIGFIAQNKLKKVSVSGGVPQTLSDAQSQGQGGSWGPDETIYYAAGPASPIWKIPAAGGSPEQVTTLDRSKGEVSHRWPQLLPGGKALLFTTWTGPGWDERHLHLHVLGTGERRALLQGASTGRYVASGQLVYSRAGALLTTPFDLARLAVAAVPPTPVELQVREESQGAEFAVSDNGMLAYISGNPQGYVSRLVIVDRKGTIEPLAAPPQPYNDPMISPDGQRAVVTVRAGTLGLWIYDFSRATLTALTTNGSAQDPVWTPDGKRIVFRQTLSGYRNLYWKPADGSGDEERLTTSENLQTAASFAPDGKWLAFWETDPATGTDIWLLPLSGDRKPQVFLKTRFAEYNPQFFTGRPVAGVRLQRIRSQRNLRAPLSGFWRQMATLDGRRQRTGVVAGWAGVVLSQRRQDDGCGRSDPAGVRLSEGAVRGALSREHDGRLRLRRVPRRPPLPATAATRTRAGRHASQRGDQLVRGREAARASEIARRRGCRRSVQAGHADPTAHGDLQLGPRWSSPPILTTASVLALRLPDVDRTDQLMRRSPLAPQRSCADMNRGLLLLVGQRPQLPSHLHRSVSLTPGSRLSPQPSTKSTILATPELHHSCSRLP